MSWLQQGADGSLLLSVHVQPGAKMSGFAGLHGDALKLRLAAPPVDGRANAALLAFLADWFGLPRSQLSLVAGQTSRRKRVRVDPPCGDVANQLHAAVSDGDS